MTVIELGDLTSGSDQPKPRESSRDIDPWLIRRVFVGLTALLCVLALTASAPPGPPRGLRALWSIPFSFGDRFALTADTLYTAVEDVAGELAAYDLADGVKRWSKRLPDPTAWPTFAEPAGVVLVPNGRVANQVAAPDGGTYFNEFYTETIALDAGTGAELWRRPGEIYTATADAVLLSDRDAAGAGTRTLRLLRIRDGGTIWTRSGLRAERVTTGGADPLRPDLLLTVTPSGRVDVLRLADATRIGAGRVEWLAGSPQEGTFTDVFLDTGRVYVRVAGPRGSSLTAYTLDTLRRLWRLDDTATVAAYPCGEVLCSIERDAFAAYDPATGTVRWRSDSVRNAWSAGPGRLLVDGGLRRALIDDSTGRRVADFGESVPVQDIDGRVSYLLHVTASPPGRTSVSRVDLATGRVELRGAIDRVNDAGCLAAADRLACPTVAGRLIVTAVG
ncbi:MAG TPA: PQQ-binding-like beta-propeller repeat protein [Actinoplanes sp.]|jgi:outer membrane protein assembly factor BamB|nr:PQQ-binding-like beta-propeller repeat protein [Actinoplanes sp.]